MHDMILYITGHPLQALITAVIIGYLGYAMVTVKTKGGNNGGGGGSSSSGSSSSDTTPPEPPSV